MSYPIMPPLPLSMAAGLKKSPNFNTVRQKGPAGVTSGIALKPYPTWDFEWSLDHITGHEQDATTAVAQMLGTFMATAGGAGLFLFQDPQNNTVTGAQFGVGDDVSVSFQLSRNIYGYPDIIQNTDGTPLIYVDGVEASPTDISSSGIITFATPPIRSGILTWAGSFYYLCRFSEDTIDATRNFTINSGIDHWMVQGVKFSSEFQSGIQSFGNIAIPGGA